MTTPMYACAHLLLAMTYLTFWHQTYKSYNVSNSHALFIRTLRCRPIKFPMECEILLNILYKYIIYHMELK